MPPARLLRQACRQLADIEHPLLHLLNGVDRPPIQLVEQRLEVRPVTHVGVFRHESPGVRIDA